MASAASGWDRSWATTVMPAPPRLSSSATSWSRVSFRATSTRLKPSRANSLASSYPIPLVAPVTRAVLLLTLPPITRAPSWSTKRRCRHSGGVKSSLAFLGHHDAIRLLRGGWCCRSAVQDPSQHPGQAHASRLDGGDHAAKDTHFREVIKQRVENRDRDERQDQRQCLSADHDRADRPVGPGPHPRGDGQRDHARDKGDRGHQDWT